MPDAESRSPTADTDAHAPAPRERSVTPRVVALCLLLAVGFGLLVPVIDTKFNNSYLGASHLPAGGIGVLLGLLALNPLLRALGRRWALGRNEMLVVYISCLFSCLVPGNGAENIVVPVLIGSFYYATPENRWFDFLSENLPSWFTPALTEAKVYNRAVVEGWYVGIGPGESIPWASWAVPLGAWGALILALYTLLACMGVMLRAQWAQREALSFPLLRLPLELTEDASPAAKGRLGVGGYLLRDPLMWLGAGGAIGLQLLNGLSLYFPEVPRVATFLDLNAYMTEPPWNQIASVPLFIFPIAIGLTFLLASDIAFSLWFGFWIFKFQLMLAYYAGYLPATLPTTPTSQSKTFVGHQQVGAFIVFALLLVWTGREHLGHIVRRAFGRAKATPAEADEALSYPVAFWGFILSLGFLVAWCCAAGMRWDVALLMWALYLVIALVLARIVVEGGLLFVVPSWIPLGILAQLIPSGAGTWLAPASIVPAAFVQTVMMNHTRAILLPSFVQSFKLAGDRRIPMRPLLGLIAACTLISLVVALWMNVRLGYQGGGLQLGNYPFRFHEPHKPVRLAQEAMMPGGAPALSWTNWIWQGVGGVATWGMMLARSRFAWFPLHPIGYLMGLTYAMHLLWFSLLAGWGCKILIMRFGGIESYRRLTPLFLGLVMGDILMALFWLGIDGWQGRTDHQLIPR